MKFPRIIAGFALIAPLLFATPVARAQTIISNETLVSTTFVVNKQIATAKCKPFGCRAETAMFAPISVVCPAAIGKTCTFHISLDTKVSIGFFITTNAAGPTGFYQFLVDGIAPTIGPTGNDGSYVFEDNVYTFSGIPNRQTRQNYTASVVTAVTNSSSTSHMISVGIGCADVNQLGGCKATAHWSTMRVDVFEP
ncbi:MAG TPA: hypothetical protein VNZ03_35255 [Terriglobales bacterium]|jgi:hypothetical protein|nr:hypothetical protein [Terriglobales bacterium]